MRLSNKLFIKQALSFFVLYLGFGLLVGNVLTDNTYFTVTFFFLGLLYLVILPFSRVNVAIYLMATTYLFVLTYTCLLCGIVFTLLVPANAMHYYGLPFPDNFIVLAFCTLPFAALFVHMLRKGCKPLDEVAKAYIHKQKKSI